MKKYVYVVIASVVSLGTVCLLGYGIIYLFENYSIQYDEKSRHLIKYVIRKNKKDETDYPRRLFFYKGRQTVSIDESEQWHLLDLLVENNKPSETD